MTPLFLRRGHFSLTAVAIVCWFILLSTRLLTPAKFDEVKIGGMFDNHTVQALKAFLQEVQAFNLEMSLKHSYSLTNHTSVLDVTDSFAVSNALCKHLSNGNLAIFGVSNASSMATIQSYTNTFQVPFVTFSMAHNTSSTSSFQIYMRPMYVHALVKLVLHYEWTHMYYVYNSDEGLIRLQQMFQAVAVNTHDKFLSIDAKRVTSEDDAYTLIENLHTQDERKLRRFVLDMPVDQAERITLRVMRGPKLNNAKFHFLLGDLSMLEMNLSSFSVGGLNITGFSLLVPHNPHVKSLLKKWPAHDRLHWPGAGANTLKYEAALAVDAVKLFTTAFSRSVKRDSNFLQRVFTSSSNTLIKCTDDSHVRSGAGVHILQEMKKTEIEGLTGHVAFDETGHRKDFTLDVYDIDMNRGTAKVGQWNERTRQLTFNTAEELLKQGATGVQSVNKTQRVTTIISEPYVMYKNKPTDDGAPPLAKDKLEGFCVDLAYAVAAKCHFDWVMHEVKDKTYGQPQDNGTWNGMVGELIRHEADMAIAPLTITADRERVVDFTKPFMSLGISIMIKKPLNHKAHVFSFMDPLSYEIWMCIVFAYIGVSVVLFLVSRFSPNEWHLTVGEHQVTNDFSISNSLWFSLGAFMQQGCDISPRSMSGRIVGSVWWFFTLIIISSYTANLAAFLTVERMLTPIDSAEDLAKQTDIQYGTVQSGSTASFFMNSKVQIYQRMWAYMTSATPSVFVKRIEEGIQRVRNSNGKYAFLLESTTNDYYNQRKPCDTMMVGQNLNSNGFGIATPIGSKMKDLLNFAVLELREKGLLAKWETVWWLQKGECENKRNSSKEGAQSALTLQNVAGIFYILIGGLVTALLSAAIEFFYKSKVDSTKYKTSFGSALRSSARLSFRGHLDSAASERYMNGSYKRAINSDRGTLMPMVTGPFCVQYTYAPPRQVGVDPYENASAHQTEV